MAAEKDLSYKNEEATEELSEDSTYILPSGQALTISETYSIAASEKSIFTIAIGATGCGKTTLISSLYQLFLFPNKSSHFYFAGSQSIMAFEERAFFTRTASYLNNPTTPRTPRGINDNILHLRLLNKGTNNIINLLLIDMSGEEYENIIGNIEAAEKNLSIVKFAKSITVLLDGEKLIQLRERNATIQQAINLLKTIFDSGLICNEAKIIFVMSKYDLVLGTPELNAEVLSNDIIDKASKQIPDLANRFKLFQVAAMPQNESLCNSGFGVENLLEQLMENQFIPETHIDMTDTDSQFDLWGIRSKI